MNIANSQQVSPINSSTSSTASSGFCNISCLPCTCISRIRDLYRAEKLGDNEGVVENALRIIEMPFNMTSSLFNAVDLFFKALLYLGFNKSTSFLKMLSKKIPIVELVIGGFETFFELRSFKQTWEAAKTLKKPSSAALAQFKEQFCQSPQTVALITSFVRLTFANLDTQKQQRYIDDYLQYTNDARRRRLEKCVGFNCAVRFHQMIANKELNAAETKELLDDLHTQIQKSLLLHALSLIATWTAIASMITMLCGCPIIIPFIFASISSGLALIRWIFAEGILPCKGWKFEVTYLIPEYLRSLAKKIFTPSGAARASLEGRVQSVPCP